MAPRLDTLQAALDEPSLEEHAEEIGDYLARHAGGAAPGTYVPVPAAALRTARRLLHTLALRSRARA